MQILSHRGYWKSPDEKNLITAIERSFQQGFGLETDLRDLFLDGVSEVIVSHDPVSSANGILTCRALVNIARKYSVDLNVPFAPAEQKENAALLPLAIKSPSMPIAINIKSDGLAPQVAQLFSELDLGLTPWFAFDMSGPEMRRYIDLGVPVFTRASEFELGPILYDHATGVWVDSFTKMPWYDAGVLLRHLDRRKQVCLVSPELHGHPLEVTHRVWSMLRDAELEKYEHFMLCTDHPDRAREFFSSERP